MSEFWGICAYFNPARYRNKIVNFKAFRESSRRQGLDLVVVELVFEDQLPELDHQSAEVYVRIHGDSRHLMWQKEALLNIALKHLPPECRYVAWLDADILFDNDDWIKETALLLQRYEVVQPYSHFVQLPPTGENNVESGSGSDTDTPCDIHSFGFGLERHGPDWPHPYGRTGNAWAARRALLDRHGFYDRLILGDADSFMAYAFTGFDEFLARNAPDFPGALIRDYRDWAGRVYEDVRGGVGHTPGRLLHRWHGSPGCRRYRERRAILKGYGYDPVAHLGAREDGLLEWKNASAMLPAAVAEYFRQRREEDDPSTACPRRKILITGMSGVVGGIVGRALAGRYELRALSRKPLEGVETVYADLRDVASIAPAFDGIDTVIHFAAYSGGNGIRHIDVNIRGSYNLLEAAARAGVKRIVYVSSGAVQEAYEKEMPYRPLVESKPEALIDPPPFLNHLDPIRPTRIYGVAKACVEIMARMYAETGKMSVICLRLGRVRPDDRPHNAREASVYLSHRDLVQLVEKSIEAPEALRFGIYYGVSDNRMRFRDLGPARDDLGYCPQDGVEPWPSKEIEPSPG